jgi:hypothetical protein
MTSNHKYFERNPETWSIIDFLNEYKVKLYDTKIDKYTKSLKAITNDQQEERLKKCNHFSTGLYWQVKILLNHV